MMRSAVVFVALAGSVWAAPKLRLVTAAVGPVSIAQSANGPAQTVEIYNAGDGTLAPRVTSSATWLVPAVGAARNCTTRAGACYPINIALQTAALAKGIYTGVLTVDDPNAIDAPQTITVTVQMGGGVPDRVDLFVAPGSLADKTFTSNSVLTANVTTATGGAWLSMTLDGGGSFQFALPYRIRARHLPDMQDGAYNGSITVSKSALTAENKVVPVTLNVTSRPIAEANPESVQISTAQNSKAQTRRVSVVNRGLGTLAVAGVAVNTAAGGNWLRAQAVAGLGNVVDLTADPANVPPGRYQGTVAIATNAANVSVNIPVDLEVIPPGPPVAAYQGLVSNATFKAGDAVAQGDIVALFGALLALGDPVSATTLPLGNEVGGARVFVNDKPAPVYYSSYGQINFQIPFDAVVGEALVRVERDGQRGNTISVQVVPRAPRLLRLGIGDYGIIVNQDGTFPIPVTPGVPSHPAKPGDALVIYALGFGRTIPVVASGSGAPDQEPLARVVPAPTVYFGGGIFAQGAEAVPFFVGLTPRFVGLYQINVFVPENTPRGPAISVFIQGEGMSSNRVNIAVE